MTYPSDYRPAPPVEKTVFCKKKYTAAAILLISLLLFLCCACSTGGDSGIVPDRDSGDTAASSSSEKRTPALSENKLPEDREISPSLVFKEDLPLDYAECFRISLYSDGFYLISICDGSRFLLQPGDTPEPEDLDPDITVLSGPVDRIYLAASACMDMFVKTGALGSISLSGTDTDKWYISEARDAMKTGSILYAGKYNAPDYELILSSGCRLAVENTMILHTPEVREQLIRTGIPVLIDHSSYETSPLGRTEWVKLYGILTGHEKEALEAFEAQKQACAEAVSDEKNNRTMAFFSINSSGGVTVRKSTDYVPSMIRLAGGCYLPDDLSDGSIRSTSTLQMEDFCQRARDADCLIYNSTIEGAITSTDELLDRAPAMKNFRAVKKGRVWCTAQDLYQDSMETGTIISDLHRILTDPDAADNELQYFYRLKA